MFQIRHKYLAFFFILLVAFQFQGVFATEFSDQTFLIAEGNSSNLNSRRLWNFIEKNSSSGIEIKVSELNGKIIVQGSSQGFIDFLNRIQKITGKNDSKIVPVFITFDGDIEVLDSIINNSKISSKIFYLPQGETWPTTEYLIQSNRRMILFVNGNYKNESKILHRLDNYVLKISANEIMESRDIFWTESTINHELFLIDEFDKLSTKSLGGSNQNLAPVYINYLLTNWTRYGKRPNFIFIGTRYSEFNFIVSHLNSFTWINGTVKVSGKILEKVYWKSQDILVTGGKFCFPYRGGEELMLSAYAPGYKMTPKQIIITGEMELHENYSIIATPIEIGSKLTGSFKFENKISNSIDPKTIFTGEHYTFTQDIERGNVIKLPENASVNLGNPEQFGLRNSSFTVSCFVKFTEILEFGDNAILGNYEREYRRGLHLILRSGHPYFGLWANDYVSEKKLKPNIWYHLVWRYIIETGEQAIFLNGENIGSSQGHPPFSGMGNILLGSALSKGASLRGYVDDLYFWSRPLGNEEINRLMLNEDIEKVSSKKGTYFFNKNLALILFAVLVILFLLLIFIAWKFRNRKKENNLIVELTGSGSVNQIKLFGEFIAIDNAGTDITKLFTPKVKELFLFVLLHSVKNSTGARIADIDEQLWPGIEPRKIANNRAVTLNKLRKLLSRIDGVEIVIENRHLIMKMERPFFNDFKEAFNLSQISGGMSRLQLETYFVLVKNGRLLKGIGWNWLDDIRGFTGNQVIDNLLKLASIYIKERKIDRVNSISKRILDYDDLNEEAIFLQVWVLQTTKNSHLAKFNFKSFTSKYEENMGESFRMNFDQFINFYSGKV